MGCNMKNVPSKSEWIAAFMSGFEQNKKNSKTVKLLKKKNKNWKILPPPQPPSWHSDLKRELSQTGI